MRRTRIEGVVLLIAVCMLAVILSAGCAPSPPEGSGSISGPELAARLVGSDAPLVLDVRSAGEFADGHIPGAVNIPHKELARRVTDLGAAEDREVVVYCRSGWRAATAERILLDAGFSSVQDLDGHLRGWKRADLPIEDAEARGRSGGE